MGANDVDAKPMGPMLDAGRVAAKQLKKLIRRVENACLGNPGLADGTTNGKAQNANAVDYRNDGQLYTEGATDDNWDFTGETDVAANKYAAYALLLDGGAASIVKHGSTDKDSAQAALDELEELLYTSTYEGKCVVGFFVTDGTAKDWDGEALSTGGTFYDGWPESLRLGEPNFIQ